MSGMTVHKELVVISITWIDLEPRVDMTSIIIPVEEGEVMVKILKQAESPMCN